MIVIRVELWPYGIEEAKKQLGVGVIANDGTGNKTYGNYDVRLWTGEYYKPWANHISPTLKGRVENHARLYFSMWHLIRKGIRACFD